MSIKETLKNIFRPAYHFAKRSGKSFVRLFVGNSFNASNYKQIPVIINNYNRLTYPRQLIDKLAGYGYTNIYILDNNSTYPPLLEYYQNAPCKVIRLKENMGYKAIWKSGVFSRFKYGYYVYTDPDVLPGEKCPEDFLLHLLNLLKKYKEIEKIGLGLKTDDLPDCYNHKQEVIRAESIYWKEQVEPQVYNAPVDTTFALYRPLAKGNAEECPAYRTGGVYIAKHLPWYECSDQLSEESEYYKQRIMKGTSVWSQK